MSTTSELIPCTSFTFNDSTYTLAKSTYTLAISDSDEELGSGDVYSETTLRLMSYTVYKYKNFDPRFICKVKFDLCDTVYLGINCNFLSQDIGEFLEATDFRNSILTNYAYDLQRYTEIEPFNKAKLLEMLAPLADTPVKTQGDPQDPLFYLNYIVENVITVSDDDYGGCIVFYSNGIVGTDLNNGNFYADIGEENVNKIYEQLTS